MARVLIVDDNPTDRNILRQILAMSGFDVAEVSDGRDVLDAMREFAPDLVTLDLFMEGKEGIETLAELSRQYPQVPVIISSCVADSYCDVVMSMGAKDCFQKPFDAKQLVARVKTLTAG